MTKKKRIGRPLLPPAKRRDQQIMVRVTPAERVMLVANAKHHGVKLASVLMVPHRAGQACNAHGA